jgi:hypothetical protein
MGTDAHTPQVADERLHGGVRVLAGGIDALYLSGYCEIPARLWVRLCELKELALRDKRAVPMQLGRVEFGVQEHGFGKYAIRLDHAHGVVGVTNSDKLPGIRFQPRAEYLHGESPEAAVTWFQTTFEPAVGDLISTVSRVDLFADFQGWRPQVEQRDYFITRARSRRVFEEDGVLTGIQFGRRGSGPTARLYDKTEDIAKTGANYWYDKWGDDRYAEESVWRAEFEFGRTVLRQFSLDGPEAVLAATGDLWRYATQQWLTLRTPSYDGTASRWPVDPRWAVIQRMGHVPAPVGLERARQAKTQAKLEWWRPRVRGALVNVGALIGATNLAEILEALPQMLQDDEGASGQRFEDRLEYRRWLASLS